MDTTFGDAGSTVLYLGALSVAVMAIGSIIHFLVIKPFKKWLNEVIESRVAKPLDIVTAEVTHNGGSSMKDFLGSVKHSVEETDKKLVILSSRLDQHLENHARKETHDVSSEVE